jgi:hypothetical protein
LTRKALLPTSFFSIQIVETITLRCLASFSGAMFCLAIIEKKLAVFGWVSVLCAAKCLSVINSNTDYFGIYSLKRSEYAILSILGDPFSWVCRSLSYGDRKCNCKLFCSHIRHGTIVLKRNPSPLTFKMTFTPTNFRKI